VPVPHSTRPTHPSITNQTSPHYAEALGTGQYDTVVLSEEAAAYFKRNRCRVELLPTPEMIPVWNQVEGAVIGLFHVTC